LENINIIIDSILDDFISGFNIQKINYKKIFEKYTTVQMLDYYNSSSFYYVKKDYDDISDTDCPQVLEAYENFTSTNKKDYMKLLNLIISEVENYIDNIKLNYYNRVEYAKTVTLSGKEYKSVSVSKIDNAINVLLFNINNNLFYFVSGKLLLSSSGVISGVTTIYTKKYMCPSYIIDIVRNREEFQNDVWELVDKNTFKINKNIFLINYSH
jgi:hypothetical protein